MAIEKIVRVTCDICGMKKEVDATKSSLKHLLPDDWVYFDYSLLSSERVVHSMNSLHLCPYCAVRPDVVIHIKPSELFQKGD